MGWREERHRQSDSDVWHYGHKSTASPPQREVDLSDNPKVGEILDHRGRKIKIVRARDEHPFGFTGGATA